MWINLGFDCLDWNIKSKCIINQLSNFPDFPWIHFLYLTHFKLLTEDFVSGRLENNRIWGFLLKDLKRPAGKQLAEKNPKLGDYENSSSRVRVAKKKFGSGRVAGTRQTLLEGQRKMINHWSVLSVRRPSKPHGAAPPNPIALCLETPAPPLETPWRCASKPQVRRASKPLGTKFETKIFKFRWFLGPSDQNELYHTPLLSKIWDLGDRKFFGGGSL